jgi:LmbE family N-acetylglucosaminyl deacetylase
MTGWRGVLPELRAYEVWTPLTTHDHVEDITRVIQRKVRALRAHGSQLKEFNYERAMKGLNAFRGELAGKCRYAEVFQTIRLNSAR